MTQTLTTEQLREIMCVYGNTHPCYLAAAECLANREAQPVAYRYRYSREYLAKFGCADLASSWKYCEEVSLINPDKSYERQKLFTAPPAPVVNPEFTGATAVPDGYCIMPLTLTAANGAKGALSGEFEISRTVRCHECGGEGCDDCADAGEFEEEITVPWDTIKDIYRAAVEACRAAMLAQPVSQGYKLVPVEPTPKQWAAGVKAMDTGMDKVTLVYKAMLAAAPEGGNG